MKARTFALCALVISMPAAAQRIDYAVRTTAGFQTDDSADAFFLDFAPRALVELSPSWIGYVRGRVFLPTERVTPFDSSEAYDVRPAHAYAAVNELWIQYGGFTSYPGEVVRFGRQHIRHIDSGWWDQDADALRWMLDTTLLDAEVGVAHPFSAFRSDGLDVPLAQRHRTYFFGQLAADWRADNTVGLRTVHSAGGDIAVDTLTWVGLYAENGYYEVLPPDRTLYYAGAITHLSGDVSAWHASVDLRWRPIRRVPLQFGGGYAWSSREFQQTGMQSNRSHFTGTHSLVNRYNETLQAHLGNLRVATAFVSIDRDHDDASLIVTSFRRDDGLAPIVTNIVPAVPVNASRDIGYGIDLVLTHRFAHEARRQRLLDRGDAFTAPHRGSLISLRASMFRPGDAYGPDMRTEYRVLLEGTLWID